MYRVYDVTVLSVPIPLAASEKYKDALKYVLKLRKDGDVRDLKITYVGFFNNTPAGESE